MRFDTNIDIGDEADVEVSVEFEPGWFRRGRINCEADDSYPDEGEGPEITKVTRNDTGEDITGDLPNPGVHQTLVEQAQHYQDRHAEAEKENHWHDAYDRSRDE